MFWEWKRYDSEILSINRLLNKEYFYEKTMKWKNPVENVHQKLVPDSYLILVNNPKQTLHATNSFKNKISWKKILKKP